MTVDETTGMARQDDTPGIMAEQPGSEIAFPRLSPSHLDALQSFGEVRAVQRGDTLFSEGDRGIDFFVILSGAVRIVETSSGTDREIAVHRAGQFTGDVDLLTGRGVLVDAVVTEEGEVLALSPAAFREAIARLPELSDVLLRAFLTRRSMLLGAGLEGLKIVGSRYSPAAHQLTDFAQRNGVPFTWLDVETDERAEDLLCNFRVRPDETPVVVGGDGELLRNPTIAQLAECIGLSAPTTPGALLDLAIVGGGPAGLAAAVYAASEGLDTMVIETVAAGGQAGTSSRIENYLGFPTGISGRELTSNALFQAQRFGARVSIGRSVTQLRTEGGNHVLVLDDDSELHARCVIIASGVTYRRLDVPGLSRYEGAGVYYAATEMEARICGGSDVVVVGGGNSAGQAIVYLSRVARRVHVVVRSDSLARSMSRYLIDRVECIPNVELLTNTVVTSFEGESSMTGVTVRDVRSGHERHLPAAAVFTFIGAIPHTDFLGDSVRLDRRGFVLTGTDAGDGLDRDGWRFTARPPYFLETSQPGVFAAGDVRSGSVKRVASAVGEGAMAVSFVHAHLALAR